MSASKHLKEVDRLLYKRLQRLPYGPQLKERTNLLTMARTLNAQAEQLVELVDSIEREAQEEHDQLINDNT